MVSERGNATFGDVLDARTAVPSKEGLEDETVRAARRTSTNDQGEPGLSDGARSALVEQFPSSISGCIVR